MNLVGVMRQNNHWTHFSAKFFREDVIKEITRVVHEKIRKISSEKFKETSWTWFNIWKDNKQINKQQTHK